MVKKLIVLSIVSISFLTLIVVPPILDAQVRWAPGWKVPNGCYCDMPFPDCGCKLEE